MPIQYIILQSQIWSNTIIQLTLAEGEEKITLESQQLNTARYYYTRTTRYISYYVFSLRSSSRGHQYNHLAEWEFHSTVFHLKSWDKRGRQSACSNSSIHIWYMMFVVPLWRNQDGIFLHPRPSLSRDLEGMFRQTDSFQQDAEFVDINANALAFSARGESMQ